MQIDYKYIKKQFEKSMKDYDKNAVVQNIMAQKLVIELKKRVTHFENVLELGCGTGLLTKQLAQNLDIKNFYGNDLVEKSKKYVQQYVPDVNFQVGNALKINFQKKMDLIVSNAMFQWFENLEKSIEILKQNIAPNGILAFTTFAPTNFKELTELTGLSLRYLPEEKIKEILINAKFEIIYSESFHEKLKFNNPLELLAHMKLTGVNSLSEKTWNIKKIKDFCDEFSQKHSQTTLTYSPIIIIARFNP